MTKKNTLIRKDSAAYETRLSTDLYPSKSPIEIEIDSSRVSVRIVRADLLDVTTITWSTCVCHYNVEECEILLSVALKTNFNSHCESVFNCF